ncbi:MAG TPA: phage portal protein [Actinomycetes bacterium]|nr:phage portal protein [Actinomycetes bacterium]
MSMLSTIARAFLGDPPLGVELARRYPDIDTQLADVRRRAPARSYRLPSVNEALGVPAILSAVQLISGTVGSLSMEAFRDGVLLTDATQIPRLIGRPNPKTTPREFWRDTAFYLASRGEAWWYVAVRDSDMAPMALVVVPPWEVDIKPNPGDRFSPIITWLGIRRDPRDMRQLTYLPSSDGLHGVGPLQLSLAAASVAIEADAWAANFFSGSLPSLIGKLDQELDETELKALDKQWLEKDNNLPRWLTGVDMQEPPYNNQKAQLTESRQFQTGEVARMFGIPGPLLEYQMSGSSLTYRNEADIWTQFINQALNPHYLEPMQQEISDLLTRSVSARFNTDQLQRADVKTRYDVYESAITKSGVLSREEARRMEGLSPGNVDFTSVPPSPPQAQYGPIAVLSRGELRCPNCQKKLAEQVTPPYRFTCERCKRTVAA